MRKIFIVSCLFLLSSLLSFVQGALPEAFAGLLARAKMSFAMPEGYAETAVTENPHMSCDYALKHPTAKFEIRYAVRPMDVPLQEYEKLIAGGATAVHPNNWLPATAMATFMNIGGNDNPNFAPLPEDGVRAEFNADSGFVGVCTVHEAFGGDYKDCMMVAIFKKDLGTAFIFFMADDRATFEEKIPVVFHTLKFD